MIPVLLVFLGGLAATAVVAATALRTTPGPDGQRAAVVLGAVGTELVVSLGLLVVAAQAFSDGDVLCPVDAQCSAPWSWSSLVLVPSLVVATLVGGRAARRKRWPVGATAVYAVGLVVLVTVLVVLGSTYRIDVPRP